MPPLECALVAALLVLGACPGSAKIQTAPTGDSYHQRVKAILPGHTLPYDNGAEPGKAAGEAFQPAATGGLTNDKIEILYGFPEGKNYPALMKIWRLGGGDGKRLAYHNKGGSPNLLLASYKSPEVGYLSTSPTRLRMDLRFSKSPTEPTWVNCTVSLLKGEVYLRMACASHNNSNINRASQMTFNMGSVGSAFPTGLSSTKLYYPYALNTINDGSVTNGRGTYPSFTNSISFMSLTDTKTETGVYFGAHDKNGADKNFNYNPYDGGVFQVEVPLQNYSISVNNDHRWTLPEFELALGVYEGEWWDSTQIYRQWAIDEAPWTQSGTLKDRVAKGDIPSDYLEAPLWFNTGWQPRDIFNISTGDPKVVLTKMRGLRKVLGDSFPINLHWYVWSADIVFDQGYPLYLPAKEGFKDAVDTLQGELNIRVFPYINGRIFDIQSPSSKAKWDKDDAQQWAVRNLQGQIPEERYGSGVAFAPMCPFTNYWEQTIANVTHDIIGGLGTYGIYIDQIGSAPPAACSATNHGHPLYGGHSWGKGNRRLLEMSATKQANGKAYGAIMTEEMAEIYMDRVAAYLSLEGYTKDSVCGYSSVYGGYAVVAGSTFHPDEWGPNGEYFMAFVIRQLMFGSALGWMSLGDSLNMYDLLVDPANAKASDFLRRASEMRRTGLEWLVVGLKMRPVKFEAEGGIGPGWPEHWPSVQVATFQASNGSLGVVVASAEAKTHNLTITLDPAKFNLGGHPAYTVTPVAPDGSWMAQPRRMSGANGPLYLRVLLDPLGVLMLLVNPAKKVERSRLQSS